MRKNTCTRTMKGKDTKDMKDIQDEDSIGKGRRNFARVDSEEGTNKTVYKTEINDSV